MSLSGCRNCGHPKGEHPINAPGCFIINCACGGFTSPMLDQVNHPDHYTWLPNGIEVIDITSHFSFTVGNALKYIMRHRHKGNPLGDLKKARWYIDYEIKRMEEEDG